MKLLFKQSFVKQNFLHQKKHNLNNKLRSAVYDDIITHTNMNT